MNHDKISQSIHEIVRYQYYGSMEFTRKWCDSFRDVANNYSNRKITECSEIVYFYKPLRRLVEHIFLYLRYFLTAEWLLEFRSYQETGLAFLESLNRGNIDQLKFAA